MKSKRQGNKDTIGSNFLLKYFIEHSPVSIQIHTADGRLTLMPIRIMPNCIHQEMKL